MTKSSPEDPGSAPDRAPLRVGVTGARGFVGRHVVHALREAGAHPVALSRHADDPVRAFALDDGPERIAAALAGLDVVVHAAAHVPRDLRDPDEAETCWRTNALGALDVARACRTAGVRRLIHVSAGNILHPADRPLREDDGLAAEHPHAPYYLGSKAAAEPLVRAQQAPGFDVLIVRPSAVYGPGMRRNVISILAERLAARQPVTLENGGRYRADFVDAADVAHVIAAGALSQRNGIVHVGSGRAVSLLELAETLCELLGADPGLVAIGPEANDGTSAGFAALDIERARAWFDYRPATLRAGLERYLAATGVR